MKIHSPAQTSVTTPAAEADHSAPAHAAANAPAAKHTSATVMPNKLVLGSRPIRVGSFDPPPGDDGDWLKRTLGVALIPTGPSARIDTPPEHSGITGKGDEWHEYPANRLPDKPDAPLNPSHMRVLVSASSHLKFIAERQTGKGVNAHEQEALVCLLYAPTLTNLPNKALADIVGYAAPNTPKRGPAYVPDALNTVRRTSKRLNKAAVATMSPMQHFNLGAGHLFKQAGFGREHIEALSARDLMQHRFVFYNFSNLGQLGLSHADIVNASGLDEAGRNALLEHGPILRSLGFGGADIVNASGLDEAGRNALLEHGPMLRSLDFRQGPQTQPIKDLIADVLQKLSVLDTAHRDAAIDIIVPALSRRVLDLSPSHIAESFGPPHPALDSVKAYRAQLLGMRSAPKSNTTPTGTQA